MPRRTGRMGVRIVMAVAVSLGIFVGFKRSTVLAEEAEKQRAENVERGHEGGQHADPIHPRRVNVGGFQNRVLTIVAGERGHTGNRDARTEECRCR